MVAEESLHDDGLVGRAGAAQGRVAKLDWKEIEPAIFGTLFECGLDPDRRSQLGAHYTDRASIGRLVEPVLLDPLRREYGAMQARVQELRRCRS